MADDILSIENLRVHFDTLDGPVEALHSVDLSVGNGEIMGLVGESGCGKSVTAQAIMRIVPPPGLMPVMLTHTAEPALQRAGSWRNSCAYCAIAGVAEPSAISATAPAPQRAESLVDLGKAMVFSVRSCRARRSLGRAVRDRLCAGYGPAIVFWR